MITTNYTVTPKVSSKIYKLLSRELGPPLSVKHFDSNSFFAEFDEFTLMTQSVDDVTGDMVSLHLYCHDAENPKLSDIYQRACKKLKHYAGVEADILDPFN